MIYRSDYLLAVIFAGGFLGAVVGAQHSVFRERQRVIPTASCGEHLAVRSASRAEDRRRECNGLRWPRESRRASRLCRRRKLPRSRPGRVEIRANRDSTIFGVNPNGATWEAMHRRSGYRQSEKCSSQQLSYAILPACAHSSLACPQCVRRARRFHRREQHCPDSS